MHAKFHVPYSFFAAEKSVTVQKKQTKKKQKKTVNYVSPILPYGGIKIRV